MTDLTRVDFYNAVARRKLGVGDDWQWYALQLLRPTEDTLVTGGVPPAFFKRGPLKGRPNWRGCRGDRVVVTEAELKQVRAEYQAATGHCWACRGSGKDVCEVSLERGVRYQPCGRCGGTGDAPAVAIKEQTP